MPIKGMTVLLHERKQTGTDPFGAAVYEDVATPVDDVLVSPSSTEDLASAIQLYGKKAAYTLAIPKGDNHEWEDTTVEFFGRKWRTFGMVIQGIEADIPTRWHKKVQVERYE